MKKIEFLTKKAITGQRPPGARLAFRIFFWATGSISIVLNTVSFIDPATKASINEIVIASNLIANALSHALGYVTK